MDQQIQTTPINYHATPHSNIHVPTMPHNTSIVHQKKSLTPEIHQYTSLAPQLPSYCRTLYQTPQNFPANLNASPASSSGISSSDSPISDDEEGHVSSPQSLEPIITSTTEEEVLDVVKDEPSPVLASTLLRHSLDKSARSNITSSSPPMDLSCSFRALPDSSYTPDLVRPFPTKRKLSDAFDDIDDHPTTEDASPDGKSKKARTNYSQLQIDAFMAEFRENPYPDTERVEEMSRDLGVPESKIKVWFQNKRARSRGKVHPVPTTQAPIYPTPMYMPVMPMHHPFMTQQSIPRTPIQPGTPMLPTGNPMFPGLPHYPMMYPAMFPHPAAFAQQAAMLRHAYYPFPASQFQLTPPMTSHPALRSRLPSLPTNC